MPALQFPAVAARLTPSCTSRRSSGPTSRGVTCSSHPRLSGTDRRFGRITAPDMSRNLLLRIAVASRPSPELWRRCGWELRCWPRRSRARVLAPTRCTPSQRTGVERWNGSARRRSCLPVAPTGRRIRRLATRWCTAGRPGCSCVWSWPPPRPGATLPALAVHIVRALYASALSPVPRGDPARPARRRAPRGSVALAVMPCHHLVCDTCAMAAGLVGGPKLAPCSRPEDVPVHRRGRGRPLGRWHTVRWCSSASPCGSSRGNCDVGWWWRWRLSGRRRRVACSSGNRG